MIHGVCGEIILNLRVNKFIETGTYLGETIAAVSSWFHELDPDFGKIDYGVINEYLDSFPKGLFKRKIYYPVFKDSKNCNIKIWSVDLDFEKQNILSSIFQSNSNINIICKSSEQFIRELIDNGLVTDRDKSFFYLDAHWGEYWPLRDEISQILRLERSVIVIDDFVVPFHPSHGFDTIGGRVCGWYYIRDCFKDISKKIYLFYPKFPNSDNRGTVIIFIGYSSDELKFMRKLPCFSPKLFNGDPYIELFREKVIFPLLSATKNILNQ